MSDPNEPAFLRALWTGLGGDPAALSGVTIDGDGDLPSAFAVSDLAAASVAAAGLAVAELAAAQGSAWPVLRVDRRLASLWYGMAIEPVGWSMPSPWDPIAGDYQARDGWIRLHTNAPHHRDAAIAVLGVPAEWEAVAKAVAAWRTDELEDAVLAQGGCAAAMRDLAAWAAHPHGQAVAAEPLIWRQDATAGPSGAVGMPTPDRPLAGLRVLDLTRVLAGPVGTRFLAGFGAQVLRIDPPTWDEPAVTPSVTLGKRCARLDLRTPEDRRRLDALLAEADILVHGYRPDALVRLGLDAEARQRIRPGLVDVSLDAYGWTGPWAGRRGFDSLVQMSSGIAAAGMRHYGRTQPTPLPVQALDHATGYLVAAAALRGLTGRLRTGRGSIARTSLARTAALLTTRPADGPSVPLAPAGAADFSPAPEFTAWGEARRLLPPLSIAGIPMRWDRPAEPLGASAPVWA
jgi:hypothetical protein